MNSSNRTLKNITDIEGLSIIKNYIKNDGASTSTTGWAAYADTAGVSPVDGTGGSPTLTITRTTSSPLSNDASFLLTKDAANRQGNGASYDFTIDVADKGRLLTVDFDYLVESPFVASSGTTESDIEVYLYDITNAALISVSPKVITKMGSTSKQFLGLFQTSTSSTSYRLILHVATTNASAYTFKFDNVKVSRANQQVLGAALEDATEFSMTIGATTTAPTKGSTPSVDKATWRRVGDSMEIQYTLINTNAGTSGTGTYLFQLPTGYTIDTTKVGFDTSIATGNVGSASFTNAASVGYAGWVKVYNSTNLAIVGTNDLTDAGYLGSTLSGLNSAGVKYSFKATVPIQGWSANAGSVINLQEQSEVYVHNATGHGSTNTKIVRYGTVGVNRGSAITYASSSTLGDTFTINESGLYSMSYAARYSAGPEICGLSKNSTSLALEITDSSNDAFRLIESLANASTDSATGSVTTYLVAGDIIRVHDRAQTFGAAIDNHFRIAKVAHEPALYGEAEAFIAATGGTITTDGNFKVHTFNSSGTFQITDGNGLVDSLVVAGGGGGGSNAGGGGGAGGYIYTIGDSMSVGSFSVTVGAGGAGAVANLRGSTGSNSVFNSHTASGGGGGGSTDAGNRSGGNGGSGGGACANDTGGTGTVGQGNNGGNSSISGGGGGGASAVGTASTGVNSPGNGGNGTSNNITGAAVTYAGGGGGSGDSSGNGTGGTGGGGAGGNPATAGTANRGGGGGGSRSGSAGQAGGSGVVIIRYQFQ